MDFLSYEQACRARLEDFLDRFLPNTASDNTSDVLCNAMRYTVLNGGKRIRPLLVYTTGSLFHIPLTQLDIPAAAIELMHCYSLIHDDLPAMDNDDLRRGMPSCHKVFGEAIAILAGDALQSLAFEILSRSTNTISKSSALDMINILAQDSGRNGMVGGQALDILATHQSHTMSIDALTNIHQKKTGALIEAAILLGALAAKAKPEILQNLRSYAQYLGLAYQIQDDLLDITSQTDHIQGTMNFAVYLGIDTAQQYINTLYQQALNQLNALNIENTLRLQELSAYLLKRNT